MTRRRMLGDEARLCPSHGKSVTCEDASIYRRQRELLRLDVEFSACFCSIHEDMAHRAFKSAQREAYRLIQSTSLGKERTPTAKPSPAAVALAEKIPRGPQTGENLRPRSLTFCFL